MAETALKEMKLELDGMPCKFQSCYQLPADRAERYCRACPGLTANNAWAVTCEWSGEVIETIVKVEGSKQEHVFVEDPIMMSEVQIPGLVEAQFTEGGAWVLGSAGMESLQGEKNMLWGVYEQQVSQLPPGCMAATRRMLQQGPVIRLFDRGPGGIRGGFSLRMADEERKDWETVNAQNKITDVPRMAHAVRYWDATARQYVVIDAALNGAPATPEAGDEWFVALIKKMKSSPYMGPEMVDNLVTSTTHVEDDAGRFTFPDAGSFSNRWTALVLKTSV